MIHGIVPIRRVVTRKLAVSHNRVFIGIMIARQRRKCDAVTALSNVAVLQAEVMPCLMHDTGSVLKTAKHRVRVVASDIPGIALCKRSRKRWGAQFRRICFGCPGGVARYV